MSKYELNLKIVKFSEMNEYQSGVYVFENDMIPGIYKIGLINRQNGSVIDRIREQESNQWTIPGSIRCLIFVPTEKSAALEYAIHNDPDLSKCRCNIHRELFKTSLKNIYDELSNMAALCSDEILIVEETAKELGLVKHSQKILSENLESGKYIYNGHTPFEFEYDEIGKWSINIEDRCEIYDNFTQFVKNLREIGWCVTTPYVKFIEKINKID